MGDSEYRFDLAAEIEAAFEERRALRLEMGTAAHWCSGIHELVKCGKLDAGEYGLKHVRSRFVGVPQFVERLSAVFARLPPVGTQLPFDDDPSKDVQVVACPGAETAVLLFCGADNELGLPVTLEHRWHGNLNASLIYLRDFQRCSYLRGVTSLSADRTSTIAELRRLVASIGACRIVCYGVSAGGLGALTYGLELEAEAVLCMSGATNITAKFAAYSPWEKYGTRAEMPNVTLDMRSLYAGTNRPPRVRLVYAQYEWDDRIQAEHMRGLSCVTLNPIDDAFEHNSTVEMIIRGHFEEPLHWVVLPAAPFEVAATTAPRATWSSLFHQIALGVERKFVQRFRSSRSLSKAVERILTSRLARKAVQRIRSSPLSRKAISSRLVRKTALRVCSIRGAYRRR
jgi:hypothetical protein